MFNWVLRGPAHAVSVLKRCRDRCLSVRPSVCLSRGPASAAAAKRREMRIIGLFDMRMGRSLITDLSELSNSLDKTRCHREKEKTRTFSNPLVYKKQRYNIILCFILFIYLLINYSFIYLPTSFVICLHILTCLLTNIFIYLFIKHVLN